MTQTDFYLERFSADEAMVLFKNHDTLIIKDSAGMCVEYVHNDSHTIQTITPTQFTNFIRQVTK